MRALVAANVASTIFMTGMIWTVQTVHYPLFEQVGEGTFTAYMAEHQSRISVLILVPWAVQGFSSMALVANPPAGVPRWLALAGLGLAGVTVLSTIGLSVPQHSKLSAGPDVEAIAKLVSTNWVRTAAWSGHSAVALAIASRLAR
jgi:hypothetical protein